MDKKLVWDRRVDTVYSITICDSDYAGRYWYKNQLPIPHELELEKINNIRYVNGMPAHRVGGPAVEFDNGNEHWYQNGVYHRIDGPAINYVSGHKEYWLYGIQYSKFEYDHKVKKSRTFPGDDYSYEEPYNDPFLCDEENSDNLNDDLLDIFD